MVTPAQSDRLPDAAVSDLTHNDSSNNPDPQKGSITFIVANTERKAQPDAMAKASHSATHWTVRL